MHCLPQEGKFDEARAKFIEAMSALGSKAELMYNIALCYYRTKQVNPPIVHLNPLIVHLDFLIVHLNPPIIHLNPPIAH